MGRIKKSKGQTTKRDSLKVKWGRFLDKWRRPATKSSEKRSGRRSWMPTFKKSSTEKVERHDAVDSEDVKKR